MTGARPWRIQVNLGYGWVFYGGYFRSLEGCICRWKVHSAASWVTPGGKAPPARAICMNDGDSVPICCGAKP
jgi:hypothetical protein